VAPSGHCQTLEFSWPNHGALVRGIIKARPLADAFAGHLLADELERGEWLRPIKQAYFRAERALAARRSP
jgi:hypothetical protein